MKYSTQDTLAQIHHVANERLNLYRLAGKQHLTQQQMNRIQEITAQLPILWDQHRREVASSYRNLPVTFESYRAA